MRSILEVKEFLNLLTGWKSTSTLSFTRKVKFSRRDAVVHYFRELCAHCRLKSNIELYRVQNCHLALFGSLVEHHHGYALKEFFPYSNYNETLLILLTGFLNSFQIQFLHSTGFDAGQYTQG